MANIYHCTNFDMAKNPNSRWRPLTWEVTFTTARALLWYCEWYDNLFVFCEFYMIVEVVDKTVTIKKYY